MKRQTETKCATSLAFEGWKIGNVCLFRSLPICCIFNMLHTVHTVEYILIGRVWLQCRHSTHCELHFASNAWQHLWVMKSEDGGGLHSSQRRFVTPMSVICYPLPPPPPPSFGSRDKQSCKQVAYKCFSASLLNNQIAVLLVACLLFWMQGLHCTVRFDPSFKLPALQFTLGCCSTLIA